MSEELAVTTATFEAEVVKSAILVVADFWAEWCGPCRMIAPVLKELARDYKDRLKVAKINVDEEPDLASRYGIQSIPTLLFFKGGEMVRQQIGAVPRAVLEKIVKELV
jgi:thioredoxin 1